MGAATPAGDTSPAAAQGRQDKTRARTCIVTRESGDAARMIRFVRSPDGVVLADLAARLPGRGAWVLADAGAVEAAAARGLFARALKSAVQIDGGPASLVTAVAAGLERRVLSGFGLARRAGSAALGFEKAHALVKAGKAALVLSADDAATDGAQKLARLAGHMQVPAARVFTSETLSLALGFDGARHLALSTGPHGARGLADLRRLAGFRPVFADAVSARSAID